MTNSFMPTKFTPQKTSHGIFVKNENHFDQNKKLSQGVSIFDNFVIDLIKQAYSPIR